MIKNNPERLFLVSILSLAGNKDAQMKFLGELTIKHFANPLYLEIFKTFCNIISSGPVLNLEVMANYFFVNSDKQKFRKICLDMLIKKYVDYSPDIELKLQSLVEVLKMAAIDRQFKRIC